MARGESAGNGYLQVDVNAALGTGDNEGKWAIQRGDISLYYAAKDTIIDAISIDVFIPSNYPVGLTMGIVFQPTSDWAWLEKTLSIKDTIGGVAPGKWTTVKWNY
jgi:hypothetical protein